MQITTDHAVLAALFTGLGALAKVVLDRYFPYVLNRDRQTNEQIKDGYERTIAMMQDSIEQYRDEVGSMRRHYDETMNKLRREFEEKLQEGHKREVECLKRTERLQEVNRNNRTQIHELRNEIAAIRKEFER